MKSLQIKPYIKQSDDVGENSTVFSQWFIRGKRWLYRGQRPQWITKVFNSAFAKIASKKGTTNGVVALDVIGRKSGRTISFPLVMVTIDRRRYLVSMFGNNSQ